MTISDIDLGARNEPVLSFLSQRRSVKAQLLTEPGPDASQLQTIITIGTRVPDHKKLTPWRFIVFQGAAHGRMGDSVAQACLEEEDAAASEVRLETERNRLLRAPLVLALISRTVEKPGVPEFEQVLSTGAVGLSVCLAANALGFGSQWLTEWIAYSPHVQKTLGLGDGERIAGFIYIGTPRERLADRGRPDVESVVTYWT
ncbi:MAG: nitroreductase [Pseudomonadota bacterium]